jgi:hypothetical protein
MSWPGRELGLDWGWGFWLQIEEAEGFGLQCIRLGELLEGGTARVNSDNYLSPLATIIFPH